MIDYSGFAFPKQRVKALEKIDANQALDAKDKAENTKARNRAKGTCEVREQVRRHGVSVRCPRKDTQTHHLIGGIGRRNRGDSVLAINKLRVCQECHDAITKNILRPTTAEHDARTVRYWRAR